MKYQIVGGAGLHRSETRMFDMMVKQLPDSWFGYAGLVVTDAQGSMEIDSLIITADRLLLIELKEWNGVITYEGGKWLQNGKPRGKSPYQIKRDHAIRLRNLLQEELSRKLGYFLHVEAHVVLCGNAGPDNLPLSERRYVHTRDEFLVIGNPKKYEKLVQETNFSHLFEGDKPRPNSPEILPIIQSFFEGPKVKALPLKENGYIANKKPFYSHPHNIYSEFRATHKDNTQHQGLLRQWDFDALGITNALQPLWAEVALRETRVGRQVRNASSTMQDYMLRSVSELSEEEVTDDARELYELRRSLKRLDEVLDSEATDWSKSQRIDHVRALLAPFSELHSLGVGHCDIDLHNLWYAGDQRSIVVTGFGAASLEGRESLESLRSKLQSAPYVLPEDAYEEAIEPYRLDVFMLAVVAYRICFAGESLLIANQVPEWKIPQQDPFGGILNSWFEQALHLEPGKRFPRADIMLNEFNSATKEQSHDHDEANQIYEELRESEFFREGMNSFGMLLEFQPLPELQAEIYPALAAIAATGSISYRSSQNGLPLMVKLWDGVNLNPQQPGINRRIHAFKQRIDKLKHVNLPTPAVHTSGLLSQGGLYVVSEHIEGLSWTQFTTENIVDQAQRFAIAEKLINTVHSFHEKQLPHGDLCPKKLLVQAGDETALILVGLLEYSDELTGDKHYQPANPESTDAFGRDCFAVYRMVEELFSEGMPASVLAELERAKQSADSIPIALDPLLQALQTPVLPETNLPIESDSLIEQAVPVYWGGDFWPKEMKLLEQNDGEYYFHCKWSTDPRFVNELRCYITGLGEQLLVGLIPKDRTISIIKYHTDLSIEQTIKAGKYSQAKIKTPLSLQRGLPKERNDFIELLMNLEAVFDAIIEKDNPNQEMAENDFDSSESSPVELWQALSDTEVELRDLVNIDSANYQESFSGCLLYPYTTESGSDLNFEFDDKIIVYLKDKRDSIQLGELRLNETTPNLLAIRFDFDAARKRIVDGSQLQLESIRDKSSRELRQRALQRVIENKAEILNLPHYFDYHQKPDMQQMQPRPTAEALRELYDQPGQAFNEQQLMAFQQLVELGPVGVLQGPPGTGKTTFISKFIHYLYKHCGVSNILLVGQSHAAVDNVAIKARELCYSKGMLLDTVRIGNELMIDEGMLNVETKALQRQIQHKFHREYDLRVSSLGKRLGMPPSLVKQICQLHRTLNPLIVSLGQSRREQAKFEQTKGGNNDYPFHINELLEQNSLFKKRTQAIISSIFDCDVLEKLQYDETLIKQLSERIAIQSGYNNPENLDRFLQLLEMSQEWMDVLHGGEAGFDRFMLKSKQLVCGTLVGVGSRRLELAESTFDWVIVDEAGRAQAAELMVALQSGKRILLVGDHKQLPPFYHQQHLKLAAKKLELGHGIFYESDFERAFKATNGVTLDTQYRMVEPIGELVSECFYAKDIGKLHSVRKNSPDWYSELPSPWNKSVSWIDSSSSSIEGGEERMGNGRYYNQREVRLLLDSLQKLANDNSINNLKQTITTEQPYPIGIITMYRQQKDEIENAISRAEWATELRDLIKINTVDSYQGQENKIIILSLVRDNSDKLQGFLRDAPRINVAISRAQERLLILGAVRMWSKNNNDSALGSVHEFISKQVATSKPDYQILCGHSLAGDKK
ncbi:AAA domain-containing protein [Pantoea sp. DY-17]|uniref:AAA domain-containing protein n=1 Tax=Pantoea sp. DY-17 TaxID=2871490 RepID=UPI001C946FDE|nr:AAA domain-containing protein [Pantoea sp. DY-17]MBY4953721.1 NERD domain-containing protein [Pantoea sp. DY-17]